MSDSDEAGPLTRSATQSNLVLFDVNEPNKTYEITGPRDLSEWVRKDSKAAFEALKFKQKVAGTERKRLQKKVVRVREDATTSAASANTAAQLAADAAEQNGIDALEARRIRDEALQDLDDAADRFRLAQEEAASLRDQLQKANQNLVRIRAERD